MNVRLISKTVGCSPETKDLTIGELLAYIARVSNPGNQCNHLTAPKLLTFCLREHHVSVFEQAHLGFEIETSLAIATQILRHASNKFQQFSGRYAEMSMGYEPSKARRQDTKDRQNSIDDLPEEVIIEFDKAQEEIWEKCYAAYKRALENQVAREVARMLLPQNTRTRMYMTGSIRSIIHYCESRAVGRGVQREHRDVGQAVLHILLQEVPELSDYFESCGRRCNVDGCLHYFLTCGRLVR